MSARLDSFRMTSYRVGERETFYRIIGTQRDLTRLGLIPAKYKFPPCGQSVHGRVLKGGLISTHQCARSVIPDDAAFGRFMSRTYSAFRCFDWCFNVELDKRATDYSGVRLDDDAEAA